MAETKPVRRTHEGRRRRAASLQRANQVARHEARKVRRDGLAGVPVKIVRVGIDEIARRARGQES